MTIESGIFEFLRADAAVAAIVGGGAHTAANRARIYPVRLPDRETKPVIVYRRISSPRESVSEGQTPVVPARFQLDMFGPSFDECRDLANAVRERMVGFHGTMDDVTVQGCFLDNEVDDPVADDLKQYRTRQDWIIWYEE